MSKTDNRPSLFWHPYHDKLIGWLHDPDKRRDTIIADKPDNEVSIRLREMQRVKGELPEKLVDACKAMDDAYKTLDAANKGWDDAYRTLDATDKARKAAYKGWDDAYKARKAANKGWDDAYKTLTTVIRRNQKRLDALHRKKCPDSVWNGKELVFERKTNNG